MALQDLVRSDLSVEAINPISHPSHGGNLIWAATVAGCSPHAILDFSASINPLGPPAIAIAAIQTHLQDLSAYPDPQYRSLKAAIAAFHGISPDWVLPGNGAAELLTWACRELAELPGVCLPVPAFGDYQRALKAFGAKIQPVASDRWNLDNSVIQPRLPARQTTGLLLNNPHNPTGKLLAKAEILPELERFALVIVDEAFMDFLPPGKDESLIEWVKDCPNLVIVRSLTKFYSLPGLRLGYAIAHPGRLQRWQQWRDPWSVNALAAAVGEVVLQDLGFQQQTWDWLETAKPKLFTGLTNLPGLQPLPGAANFLLVGSEYSVTWLQTELLKRHQILIRDCLSFAELGDRYFRVAIRTEAENQQLLEGLADVIGSRG